MPTRRRLRVLFVDDNPTQFDGMEVLIQRRGEKYDIAEKVSIGLDTDILAALAEGRFDIVFLDIVLETSDGQQQPRGIEVLRRIRKSPHKNTPVVMFTNYAEEGRYQEECQDSGCDGFLSKSIDARNDRLKSVEYVIDMALRMGQLREQCLRDWGMECVRRSASDPSRTEKMSLACISEPMQRMFNAIVRVAAEPSNPNILILGENGTGKSTVARMIHCLSNRVDQPFVEVVLNAIPAPLIEATLFGIVPNFATGVKEHKGILEICKGGTLFLDEIGELPLDVQVKLLRAIREKKITPVGATQDIDVDFRLITATNRDILQLISAKEFRLDLYYRIQGVQLSIPSLADRIRSVKGSQVMEELFKHEMKDMPFTYVFTEEAKDILRQYQWPGNYAEFKTLLENLALECTTVVTPSMLKPRLLNIPSATETRRSRCGTLLEIESHDQAVGAFRKEYFEHWIELMGGVEAAAERIGVHPSTIHRVKAAK